MTVFQGTSISKGIAIGPAFFYTGLRASRFRSAKLLRQRRR